MSTLRNSSIRWWALAILSLTELVVVLDTTIVTIALPQAQIEIGLTDVQRQWILTAYALAFGSLLLLGGRIADYWGRKRTFLVGMVGFGIVSAWGGLAQSGGELIIARGIQGVFGAMLAPASLAMVTVMFPHGKERNIAFAIFGTVAGSGAAIGLVLGGVLTEFASWRWCLLVNVFFVIIGLIGGALVLKESKAEGDNRYDLWGAITVTLGLVSLVYGFTRAEHGWGSIDTIGFLALGAVLLAVFILMESKVRQPLLPLHIIVNSVRGGTFLIQAVAGAIMVGSILYLTFYFQIVLSMGPLISGLANVAMTVVVLVSTPFATRALGRFGPRPLMILGPLFCAAGLFAFLGITPDGNYFTQVLPGLVLLGIGFALLFVPLQNLALTGIESRHAGVASAIANSTFNIGGAIGLAVFTALYANAEIAALDGGADQHAAFTDGYITVFIASGIAMVLASLIATFLIRGTKEDLMPSWGDEDEAAHAH